MFNFLRKEQPTGMIPDPQRDNDPRNLLYDDIAPMSGADVPVSGDVEKESWTLNQDHTTACTCHSTVHALFQVTGQKLSPRYAFREIKTNPKYPSSQLPNGAYMIDSVKFALNEGLPSYDICPNYGTESDAAYLNFAPTVSVTEDAKLNKGGAYVYVTSGNDNAFKCAQIRRYMHEQGKPVKVGITWHSSFNQARKGGVVPVTTPTGKTVGHDMLAVAWDVIGGHEYIGFRNSFGEKWGDKGRIWIPCSLLRISAGIAIIPPAQVIVPPKVENRDIHLETYNASKLRKVLYEKFPLEVAPDARAKNTIARSFAGKNWLVLVQAISYRGWSITDVINHAYALSRNKKESTAFRFDFNQYK